MSYSPYQNVNIVFLHRTMDIYTDTITTTMIDVFTCAVVLSSRG